jgi:enoyl-CoA hydratase/carnithine racemase
MAAGGIKLGMPPAKLGLVYSHTGLRKFLDVVGAARTRELFLVGRNIDALTAERWGLVNQVVDGDVLEEEALDLAVEIAANAPLSLSGNKEVIRTLLAHEGALPADEERRMVELRRACFASEDFQEGVRAFGEKRAPRWQGR